MDFNCPVKDGVVTDNTRIRAALPTIKYLRERGARVVLLSHLGRPKGGPDPKYSLQPVVRELERLLGAPVTFLADPDLRGGGDGHAADAARRGRRRSRTRGSIPARRRTIRRLAARFAALGDFYVNDAFGSAHRAHASTEAVARLLKPAVSGFLMEQELRYLGEALHQPKRPFVAVLGGAKISGKIDLIEALLPKVDAILLGGAMACTFFRAMGLETGKSLVEADRVDMARELMTKAGGKLVLPAGGVIAQKLEAGVENRAVARDAIPAGWAVFDIDPATERDFAGRIAGAGTVVWNGPMGVFETPPFDHGTLAVARAMAEATGKGAITVIGGGDSAAAVAQAGLDGPDHPRLDRRRRVARVSRGQGAARRRGARRCLTPAAT